jgi:hypothetical protein
MVVCIVEHVQWRGALNDRAAHDGLQGLAGVKPDATLFGKAVGGGLPVGAIGGSRALMEVLVGMDAPGCRVRKELLDAIGGVV